MINIVCFWTLPEGGKPDEFTKEYVDRLAKQVSDNVTVPHNFYCYTDRVPAGGIYRKLDSNLAGWWAKLTLFGRKELRDEPVLYVDLDTIITGNIDHLCRHVEENKGFTILRDFYRENGYGSGLMGWNGDYSDIWYNFNMDPMGITSKYGGVMGDQWFIETQVKDAKIWQDKFPDEVVSYKVHCQNGLPKEAKIVCFHGKPRPHEVEWKI